ncbi:RimK-like ATPgrasp N-terminal domain-containing protein, partial [Pseudomonas syringae]
MSAAQVKMNEVSAQLARSATTKHADPTPPFAAQRQLVIIVERLEDWASYFPSEDLISAQDYLEKPLKATAGKRVQVINLCRSYKYLGHGYYCSLLAEARQHTVIPSVKTISELTRKSLYGLALDDLDKLLETALEDHPYDNTEGFTLTLYFGQTTLEPLKDLARQLFEAFPCPILMIE